MKVYPFVCIHERNEVNNMNEKTFNDVVNHMKTSGFVYQGSEIYGGLANTWDFGPLGIELKILKMHGGNVSSRKVNTM